MVKSLVWSAVLHAAETWAISRRIRRELEAFEMWIWRMMQKVSYTEHRMND